MNLKPLGDRIIIKQAEAETTSAGGIIIPGSGEKPNQGEVLAIGTKCEEVKVGDVVLYDGFTGKEITDGANDFIVVKEEDITAIIK